MNKPTKEKQLKKACDSFAEEFIKQGKFPEHPTPIIIKLPKPMRGRDVL